MHRDGSPSGRCNFGGKAEPSPVAAARPARSPRPSSPPRRWPPGDGNLKPPRQHHEDRPGCPQRILLPNDRAIEPQSRDAYERFGLNERQVELIARAMPKRHYYLQSARGNRLFELGLGPIALTLCGASDPASQKRIDTILVEHGPERFASALLDAAGLDWVADLTGDFDLTIPDKGDL